MVTASPIFPGGGNNPEYQKEIAAFLAAHGWDSCRVDHLAGDASERRYSRLYHPDKGQSLLMRTGDAQTFTDYIKISAILERWQMSVPRIHGVDRSNGWILIEDFGIDSYRRCLDRGQNPTALYRLAVDALIALYRQPTRRLDVEDYRRVSFRDEYLLLPRWHCPASGLTVNDAGYDDYTRIWDRLLEYACRVPTTLILRDFHIDNMFHLPGRKGVRACGLIDFQDARIGPCTYDLVSLLHDVRCRVSCREEIYDHFFNAFPAVPRETMVHSCMILNCHRLCKIAGVFVRLEHRYGKSGYRRWLPYVWQLLNQALLEAPLAPMREWFDRYIPIAYRRPPPAVK